MRGVNGARGEAAAVLAGAERRLCLTLGALAESETALGVSGVAASYGGVSAALSCFAVALVVCSLGFLWLMRPARA